MRFSVEPFAGDSGFTQWHDAMKMCARLPGGIPPEFRRRMWLTLAEQHVRRRGITWKDAEKTCFNEWATPDDEGLGDQIIKDLHRTGCSLFCGADAEVNQALLKRVLLGYARWNKSVGYCQGFNMLAAIILEVMDKQESDALKVMIYLIEGVLPESYFANNLRGLSVDMAVFRELMRLHLPELSRHLETLQHEAADQATGACYEPPLTNVFTMQWFLTLFSNCLPRDAVMRVWDLTFLQGNEMLLRTALAIWGRLAPRILEVPTADEFYTVMGDLTREMLVQGLMDANQLVQTLVGMAPFPFPGLAALRDKYTYNITPWTQSVSTVARKGLKIFLDEDEEEEKADPDDVHQKMAIATVFGLAGFFRKSSDPKTCQGEQLSTIHETQDGRSSPVQLSSMRPNLDISALKKQYTKLRERQRQAHIILTGSNIRKKSIDEVNKLQSFQKTNQLTMKHLLRGKKALTTRTKRAVAQGVIPPIITKRKVERKLSDSTGMKRQNGSLEKPWKFSQKPVSGKAVEQSLKSKPSSAATTASLPGKKALLSESSTVESPKTPLPPETLHWKDTPKLKRARRASLPYGVKLMEIPTPPPLPEIKDEDMDECSSSSTELCDDDLAVLSEEEAAPALVAPRPSSTSPRLENREQGIPEDRFETFLEDSKAKSPTKVDAALEAAKECQVSCADEVVNKINKTSSDASPNQSFQELSAKPEEKKEEPLVPNVLPIPAITEPFVDKDPLLSNTKTSLSSPTKWKWSFSEIENPDLIPPVSPILKLRNFLSDETLAAVDDQSFPPTSPTITVNAGELSSPGSVQEEQERSNIFAYLFEITDVTKLSNVNSEEPSPNDDVQAENHIQLNEFLANKSALVKDNSCSNEYLNYERNFIPSFTLYSETDKPSVLGDVCESATVASLDIVETEVPSKLSSEISIDDKPISCEIKTDNKGRINLNKTELTFNASVEQPTSLVLSNEFCINSTVSEKDRINPTISEKDFINPTVSEKDRMNPTASEKDRINPSVSEKDFINPTVSEKDRMNPTASEKDRINPTVSEKDRINSPFSEKDEITAVFSEKDHAGQTISERDNIISAAVTEKDCICAETGEKNRFISKICENECVSSLVCEEDFVNSIINEKDKVKNTCGMENESVLPTNQTCLSSAVRNIDLNLAVLGNLPTVLNPNQQFDKVEEPLTSNIREHERANKIEEKLPIFVTLGDTLKSDEGDTPASEDMEAKLIRDLRETEKETKDAQDEKPVIENIKEAKLKELEERVTMQKPLISEITENVATKHSVMVKPFVTDMSDKKQVITKNLVTELEREEISIHKPLVVTRLGKEDLTNEELSETRLQEDRIVKDPLITSLSEKELVVSDTEKQTVTKKLLVKAVENQMPQSSSVETEIKNIATKVLLTEPTLRADSLSPQEKLRTEHKINSPENDQTTLHPISPTLKGIHGVTTKERKDVFRTESITTASSELDGRLNGDSTQKSIKLSKNKDARESLENNSKDKKLNSESIDLESYCTSKYFKVTKSDSGVCKKERIVSDSVTAKPELLSENIPEPPEDNATEVVRRKLWAGVKSLSLDAEILIATNKSNKCVLDFSATSLPILDESPLGENCEEPKKDVSAKNTSESASPSRKKLTKRRNSEAALQLMKENTKIIDQILNQRYEEGEENVLLVSQKEMNRIESGGDSPLLLKRKSFSDQSISESLLADADDSKSETRLKTKGDETLKDGYSESGPGKSDVKKSSSDSEIPECFLGSNSNKLTECSSEDKDSVSSVPFITTKQSLFSPKAENIPSFEEEEVKDNKVPKVETKEKDSNESQTSVSTKIVPFSKLSKLSPKTVGGTPSCSSILTEKPVSYGSPNVHSKEIPYTNFSFCPMSPEESCSKLDSLMNKSTMDKSRPANFNPFPTKPLNRPPKEAALKLGLYNSSKSSGNSSS